MDHPLPWLRYVDASDLDNAAVPFDGMTVESTSGEHLGKVDGFIVDASSGRPYHLVVDAGGWFKSKLFLLPVGHVGLTASDASKSLTVDVDKERITNYPGFNRNEFEKLTDADLEQMNRAMASACCPRESANAGGAGASMFDTWSHYRMPSWWDADFYRPDRVDDTARSMAGTSRQR